MLRASYPFLVICALALAHIHLQFVRIDMLMQQSQLQGQHRQLLREENVLKHKLASMGNMDALKDVARKKLNMHELENPTKDLLAKIPASVQAKYFAPLEPDSADVLIAKMENDRQRSGIRAALMSLIDGGRAVASVNARQP
jgi:cell division protein FtsL